MEQRKNTGYQNLLASILLVFVVVGAYHVFIDWLLSPLVGALEFISSIRFENKVLLVILLLGLFAIWTFRTKQPK